MANKKGFTLIEVILSIALISVIAIVMLTIFSSGLISIVRAGVRTEAVDKAEFDFLNNATIVGNQRIIDIELPIPGGFKTFTLKGYNKIGNASLQGGKRSKVDVEIKAFVVE